MIVVSSPSEYHLLDVTRRYWVIAVVPYLLYAFVVDHSVEDCKKIYKACIQDLNSTLDPDFNQIPVALAMWNQVGSECRILFHRRAVMSKDFVYRSYSCPAYSNLCLFQSEQYAASVPYFFSSRVDCISAIRRHVSNAWYDARHFRGCLEMSPSFFLPVLPFVKPPFVSTSYLILLPILNSILGSRSLLPYVQTPLRTPSR